MKSFFAGLIVLMCVAAVLMKCSTEVVTPHVLFVKVCRTDSTTCQTYLLKKYNQGADSISLDSLLTQNPELQFKGEKVREQEFIQGVVSDTLLLILE